MSQMVRKQIYIEKRQNAWLKRQARARKASEAEIIRQALDHEAAAPVAILRSRAAFKEILATARARLKFKGTGEPYRWKRSDAYEDREARFDKFSHPELDK